MKNFAKYALKVPEILLPEANSDLYKWAVIACDQFTAQPEYWEKACAIVENAPSTLNIVYPEAWLDQGDARIASINETMARYAKDVVTRRVNDFIVVEREMSRGKRIGLMAEVDLEAYDPSNGSASLIRATEGTIAERIPPRVRIRKDAPLETPHILLLADDPEKALIEPLYDRLRSETPLYDTPLMLGGGHVRGWRVPNALHEGMLNALEGLYQAANGLLFAAGDGNHSLATARKCWLDLKETLSDAEKLDHPARYALVEIENVYDESLVFEPIHRVLFGDDAKALEADFAAYVSGMGMRLCEGGGCALVTKAGERAFHVENDPHPLPLYRLQKFLDERIKANPSIQIDYVHGADAVRDLAKKGAIGLLVPAMDKRALFEGVRRGGSLPRKTFSMGEAVDKRYYLECRAIRREGTI